MSTEVEENSKLIEGNLGAAAARYLTIYLGEPTVGDWNSHIADLYARNEKKQKDNIAAFMRNAISCAILAPLYDNVNTDHPENVLHKVQYWRQINEQDWFEILKRIAAEDMKIMENRAKMLSLGVIEPLAWQTNTRQAYNWLSERAKDSGSMTEDNQDVMRTRLSNVVYAYGGAVVCAVFMKNPDWVKKLTNWKTGYFFEKLIYKVFTPEEMYKLKKAELEKSNEKLVKSVRI